MDSDKSIKPDRWLRHLKRYLRVARKGDDPEGVHQVRVATRHLDVWLLLGGWRVYRDDLRWLRTRASAVRDLDVVLARRGLPVTFRHLLTRRKNEAQAEFVAASGSPRLAAVHIGLAAIPALEASEAHAGLEKVIRLVIWRGRAVETDNGSLEALHGLRRALRRLRYGLESVGEKTTALKELQESLGQINDLAIAVRLLEGLPPSQSPARFRQIIEDELRARVAEAHKLWSAKKGTIANLV